MGMGHDAASCRRVRQCAQAKTAAAAVQVALVANMKHACWLADA